MAAARFRIEREAGISLGTEGDGKIVEGALRYVSRVYAMRVSKTRDDRGGARAARRRPRPYSPIVTRPTAHVAERRASRASGSCRTSSTTSTCPPGPARAIRGRARRTRTCSATACATTATASACWRMFEVMDRFEIPLHVVAQSRGATSTIPEIMRGVRGAQLGRACATASTTRAITGTWRRTRSAPIDRRVRGDPPAPHRARNSRAGSRPPATFTAEHARPRRRGRHQILLRLVPRRSAVPDAGAQRQPDHDPVPDGHQRCDDLPPAIEAAEFAQMVIDHFDCAVRGRPRNARW